MSGILIILPLFFAAAFANGFYGGYGMGYGNTFLVTMGRAELMKGIVSCVADSRDPRLCDQFTKCWSMLPPQVLMPYKQCRQALSGTSWPQCYSQGAVFSPAPVREKIFDCMNANSRKETPAEEMAVVQVETCLRALSANGCVHQRGYYGYY